MAGARGGLPGRQERPRSLVSVLRRRRQGGERPISRWRTYHLAEPPKALGRRGVRLDNVALMPASALPYKDKWQAIANRLPNGEVLILLPAADKPQRKTLA